MKSHVASGLIGFLVFPALLFIVLVSNKENMRRVFES